MTQIKCLISLLILIIIFHYSVVHALQNVLFSDNITIQLQMYDTSELSTIQGQKDGFTSIIDIQPNYMDITLDPGSSVTFTSINGTFFRYNVLSGSGYSITPLCPTYSITLSSQNNAVIRITITSSPPPCVNTNSNSGNGGSGGGGGGGGGGGSSVVYHNSCLNNMCVRTTGLGVDQCNSHRDCKTNAMIDEMTSPPIYSNNNTNSDFLPFTDINEHWAKSYITHLATICNVEGYRDQEGNILFLFHPDRFISRAELVKILIQCQYGMLPSPNKKPFPDVEVGLWYSPYIAKGKELQWIDGYHDTWFRPDQSVTRAEATKIIILSQYPNNQMNGVGMFFLDTIPGAWYERFIVFAQEHHFIDGYLDSSGNPTGYFGPENYITRAEAAKIISSVKGW